MNNPFPGMNPYLEQPELWHQVHNRLIIAIADDLTPQVAPAYLVAIEERIDQSVEESLLVGITDVALNRRRTVNFQPPTSTATAHRVDPSPVRVPMPEEIVERFLEVRLTRTGDVVCVIEILSPKNKRSKDGRAAYETKRQKILGSSASLVEIDLLRVGESMTILDVAASDYRILVSRSHCRPTADLYTFGLRDSIPVISIPLKPNDLEPTVDLQRLLDDTYRRARFDLAIDYSQPLKPALDQETATWVEEILQLANLNRLN